MNKKTHRKKIRTTLLAWGLVLPSFVFLCLFTLYPILQTVYKSFFSQSLSQTSPIYCGLQNFLNLAQDGTFKKAFINNLIIAAVTIPASVGIGVLLAQFANSVRHGKAILRIAFFYPTILPMIAVANIWLFIYTPQYGLAGVLNSSWNLLGTPGTVLAAIIVMLVWKQSGYVMIFYLSGLQNIPQELYEAAKIDGAGPARTFHSLTWPLLRPTTLFVTIITMTDAYKIIDYIYTMTQGGPDNASNLILYYIYQVGFEFWNSGAASALTTILIAMLMLISSVLFYTRDRKTFYQ
jgi:ABC-type sugar transport systems, permease components